MAFVQRNSDQNICMDDTMCTNLDIIGDIVLKKKFFHRSALGPLNIGNTINASDNFAKV